MGLNLLEVFLNQPVQIDTSIGSIAGILRGADLSRHGRIGCLLLETKESWLLVKEWTTVKGQKCDDVKGSMGVSYPRLKTSSLEGFR